MVTSALADVCAVWVLVFFAVLKVSHYNLLPITHQRFKLIL